MGTELLCVLILGFLLLGPRKLPAILGHIARAKAQLKRATHSFTTELDAASEPHSPLTETNFQARTGERQ